MKRPVRLLALLMALAAQSAGADARAARAEHQVGSCRVASFAESASKGEKARSPARSIMVDTGRYRVLVAPAAGAERAARVRRASVDAVLLTSLAEERLSGVVEAGQVGFPKARILVDRAVLERAEADDSSTPRLRTLVSSGRLLTPEANVDVLPGVRFAIPPPSDKAATSRVRIRCGDVTLLFLSGAELALTGLGGEFAVSLDREDPARLRTLADDEHVIAVTDGYYPALAYIYRHHDGFRLGSVQARETGGVPRRSGRVFVDIAEDVP